MKSEAQIIAELLDNARDLTNYYLEKLKDKDKHKVFEANGKKLNNVIWLIAHITVSENWLVFVCTGHEHVKIPWARQFGLGSTIPSKSESPPFNEVLDYYNKVHLKAIDYINSLTSEDLNKPTINGVKFGGEDSVRAILKHAIRHETTHTGHLSWLCKLFDEKTI